MNRTWMFIPGSQDRYLKRAKSLPADVLIFDLEDAVSIKDKEIARKKVKKCIQSLDDTINYVRVNALSTPHFLEDIKEIIGPNLSGIILPKTNTKEDIIIADYILKQSEKKQGHRTYSYSIIPLIETGKGLYNAYSIASASKRIKCLSFGSEDYKLDMGIQTDKSERELIYARSKLVTVSKSAGIEAPIDSVYIDFNDNQGLKESTENSRSFGFQGKFVIHPKQIEVINQVFSPTLLQINNAKKIVKIYDFKNAGVIEIDGKMIDLPVAEQARKILDLLEEE